MGIFNKKLQCPMPFHGKWGNGEITVFVKSDQVEIYNTKGAINVFGKILHQNYQGNYSIASKYGGDHYYTSFLALGNRVDFSQLIFKISKSSEPFTSPTGFMKSKELLEVTLEKL